MTYEQRKMGRVDGVAGDSENIGEFVTDCVSSGSRGMSLREALAKKRRRLVACASEFQNE